MSGPAHLEAAAILRKHGIRPRHRLGQNFLHDPAALQQIVDAAEIRDTDAVLEIGCGLGGLTHYLAQAAQLVVAVELDARLAGIARESLAEFRNVRIVQADFLHTTPHDLGLPELFLVVANIPYYVTSPILQHLLESQPGPRRMVLTVQKEVAQRICAAPPDMSLLAISVQIHGRPEIVATIPARAFHPVPKVDSAVVRVECYDRPVVSSPLISPLFRVARAGFSQSRKMLRNALSAGLGISSLEAQAMLLRVGIDPRRRAETLAISEWSLLGEDLVRRPV